MIRFCTCGVEEKVLRRHDWQSVDGLGTNEVGIVVDTRGGIFAIVKVDLKWSTAHTSIRRRCC